jgi:serine protease AprX
MHGSLATFGWRPRRAAHLTPLGSLLAVTAIVAALLMVGMPRQAAPAGDGAPVAVIVRKLPGAGVGPERLVERLGGQVQRPLGIIDGFSALVPASRLAALGAGAGVREVSRNGAVHLLGSAYDGVDPASTMSYVANLTHADTFWNNGYTGKGVGVALIDSGIAPVPGLNGVGKVVDGPDLSFESQSPDLRYLDTFGHGTHMAGIIAGKDSTVTTVNTTVAKTNFVGMAPDAKIISLKVADQAGATDISQIIAAIDWVVQHRNDPGLNIKVLNLSFGTDGEQSYTLDPLAYAAEVAWRAGITVVVAGGNAGHGSPKLNNPAYDPFVIAVASATTYGQTSCTYTCTVSSFSSSGDQTRYPDFLAPGQSISSLRVPGSALDQAFPAARQGTRMFRGSGTSQAAAVVSGSAALIAQRYPTATPDQIKFLLRATSFQLGRPTQSAGAGIMNLSGAYTAPLPSATASAQTFTRSTGTGKLDLARGTARVVDNGVTLTGEKDIMGRTFASGTWAAKAGTSAWSGGIWNSSRWTGDGWSGSRWTASAWSGSAWSGTAWSSVGFSSSRWTGSAWSGSGFSGSRWTSSRWTSNTWSSAGWG